MSIQILNIDSGKRAVVISEGLYNEIREMLLFECFGGEAFELLRRLPELTVQLTLTKEIK